MPFLDWVNKSQAVNSAAGVPYHLLQFQSAHGDVATDNLLIQGDNLLALKALLPFYRGKVKCIYIDPPYNTQSAFTHYDDKLEHSQWLTLMYPRLVMLRELLADDGFIFVQIDYRESAKLKLLLDEVFGTNCFRNEIIVGRGIKNIQSQFDDIDSLTSGHDTIYLYAKNQSSRLKTLFAKLEEPQPGKWDTFWRGTDRPTMRFELFGITPPKGQWRWSKDRAYAAKEAYEEYCLSHLNRMTLDEYWKKFEENTGNEPNFIRKGQDGAVQYYVGPRNYKMLSDVWLDIRVLGKISDFPHEKHEELLGRIIDWVTNPGDLVLDSFLGSGTTAAVAHKMGRRWIGIEMGEHAVTHCLPRLEKVIAGEQGGISKAVNWQGGGGFRFHTLGEPVFDANGAIHPNVRFASLAGYVWHFETGEPWATSKPTLPDPPLTGRETTNGETITTNSPPLLRGARGVVVDLTPLLGIHNNTAYYLLYNGILGDRRPQGGNVLTSAVLAYLDETFPHNGPRIIYGETTRLGEARLRESGITFKQIPYDIKAR